MEDFHNINSRPQYSVVVPVYNSDESLPRLSTQLKEVFETLNESYELILINDASTNPNTWKVIKRICKDNSNIVGINLTKNFGQQNATICGLHYARGNFIITMDDDLQHSPYDIPRLIEHRDHDIVIGTFLDKKHSVFKVLASKIKGYFDKWIISSPIKGNLSSFRLLSKSVVSGVKAMDSIDPFLPALIFSLSRDTETVHLSHHKRLDGKSGYTLRKQLKLFSNLLINNSSMPLRLIGYLGLLIFGSSLLTSFYLAYVKLRFNTVPAGWTSNTILILLFGSLQLLAFGILGEYLIRILKTIERKPIYHIKEVVNLSTPLDS